MARIAFRPRWRWPIYAVALIVALAACYSFFGAIMIGNSMGWSGRSSFQIALGVTALAVSSALAYGLAIRAILAAKDRRRGAAVAALAFSLLPLPLAWLAFDSGLV